MSYSPNNIGPAANQVYYHGERILLCIQSPKIIIGAMCHERAHACSGVDCLFYLGRLFGLLGTSIPQKAMSTREIFATAASSACSKVAMSAQAKLPEQDLLLQNQDALEALNLRSNHLREISTSGTKVRFPVFTSRAMDSI